MRTRELTEKESKARNKTNNWTGPVHVLVQGCFRIHPPVAIPWISLGTAIWFYRSRALSSSGKCWPPVSRMGRQKRRSSLSFGSINGTLLRRSQPSASSFTTKGRKRLAGRGGGEEEREKPDFRFPLLSPTCLAPPPLLAPPRLLFDVRLPPLFPRFAHRRGPFCSPNSLDFRNSMFSCGETARKWVAK